MHRTLSTLYLILISSLTALSAAPLGAFDGSFPSYSFTAVCADPIGGTVFPGGTCNLIDIDYTATGTSSLFANAKLEQQTLLVPFLPGPFPFSGTFVLTDLDNPGDSIFGTLTGQGQIAGPPGPPVGFPPFSIHGIFETTGGTGAFEGAKGLTSMSGTSLFTVLSGDATFASGEGSQSFAAIPEPGTVLLMLSLIPMLAAKSVRRKRGDTANLQSRID